MPYTHNFQFETPTHDISGQISFNAGTDPIYKTNEPHTDLKVSQLYRFVACLSEIKKLFDSFEGIDKIKISRTSPPTP